MTVYWRDLPEAEKQRARDKAAELWPDGMSDEQRAQVTAVFAAARRPKRDRRAA